MADNTQLITEQMSAARTTVGCSLLELSERSPLLVVFLRHSGCTFCRQALDDLARQRQRIEALGVQIVIVHMDDIAKMQGLAAKYGLGDVVMVADPQQQVYQAFDLQRGNLWQILGPGVIWRGLKAALLERHGFGVPSADVRQLPGAFLVRHGKVERAFYHRTAADRPDYCSLSGRCSQGDPNQHPPAAGG